MWRKISEWLRSLGPEALDFDFFLRHLREEMEARKRTTLEQTLVPNQYTLLLNPTDWAELNAGDLGQELCRELEMALEEEAGRRGYRLLTRRVRVSVQERADLERGAVGLESDFVPPRPGEEPEPSLPLRASGGREIGCLEGLSGPVQGKEWPVRSEIVRIGRAADNDLVLPVDTVSNHHAQLEQAEGRFWLLDLNSTNGTYVNGRQVSPGERWPLQDGDELDLGGVELRFRIKVPIGNG